MTKPHSDVCIVLHGIIRQNCSVIQDGQRVRKFQGLLECGAAIFTHEQDIDKLKEMAKELWKEIEPSETIRKHLMIKKDNKIVLEHFGK